MSRHDAFLRCDDSSSVGADSEHETEDNDLSDDDDRKWDDGHPMADEFIEVLGLNNSHTIIGGIHNNTVSQINMYLQFAYDTKKQ